MTPEQYHKELREITLKAFLTESRESFGTNTVSCLLDAASRILAIVIAYQLVKNREDESYAMDIVEHFIQGFRESLYKEISDTLKRNRDVDWRTI